MVETKVDNTISEFQEEQLESIQNDVAVCKVENNLEEVRTTEDKPYKIEEVETTEDKSFEDLLPHMLECFDITDKEYKGFLEGEEKFQEFLKFVNASGYYFYKRTSRTYSKIVRRKDSATYHFHLKTKETVIPFFGSIFEPEGVSYYSCIHGDDHIKKPRRVINEDEGDMGLVKRRRKLTSTKRVGCKAKMIVKQIRVYPEYRMSKRDYSKKSLKLKMVKEFKKDLKRKRNVLSYVRYYVWLSKPTEHSHTKDVAERGARLHPKLVSEIHNLVEANVRSVDVIKFHLQLLVESMFSNSETKPEATNTCFYPTNETIYSHIYGFLGRKNRTKIGQDALGVVVKKWKSISPDDHILFRPFHNNPVKGESRNTFLFCHQTVWQQQILARYGNNLCLLDSVSKTTVPLYFLTVKTNVDYCVVGTFAIEGKSREGIAEALTIFFSWNTQWEPKYFMTDRSNAEIRAVEGVFPGCKVYISEYQRERAWSQWLEDAGIVGSVSDDLKQLWYKLAHATTEIEYHEYSEAMFAHDSWKISKRVHEYFRGQWLRIARRWIDAFSDPDYLFMLRVNNGIEMQNNLLTQLLLGDQLDKPFTEVLTMVVEQLVPESFRQYTSQNGRLGPDFVVDYTNVPAFLENRPYHFVKHVMERLSQAESFMGKISHISDGVFCIESEADTQDSYVVISFQPVSCTCNDFLLWNFPCKHFCVIFLYVSGWTFDSLPDSYKNSVFLMVDTETDGAFPLVETIITESDLENGEGENESLLSYSSVQEEKCSEDVKNFIEVKDAESKNSPRAVRKRKACSKVAVSPDSEDAICLDERTVILKQVSVREKLQEAIKLSYLCQDVKVLDEYGEILGKSNVKLKAAARTRVSFSARALQSRRRKGVPRKIKCA